MKITTLISLTLIGLAIAVTPVISQAQPQDKADGRKVIVNGKSINNSKSTDSGHSGKKVDSGKNDHRSNDSHKSYNNTHRRTHHSTYRRSHHDSRNFFTGMVLGATLQHSFGPHGSHYNGIGWCGIHGLYHTHSYDHVYYHYDTPRKVDSYIELDDGVCYGVTEYSNGDQRRKRIRDHYCAELDEWDEWEEE